MSKEIKSIGLAIAALPFAFAMLGLLEELGVVEKNSPSAWSTMKFVAALMCGAAYYLGTRIFVNDESADVGSTNKGES
jgi:hypothetical protein